MQRTSTFFQAFARKRSTLLFFIGIVVSLVLICAAYLRSTYIANQTHVAYNSANASVLAFNEVRSALFDLRLVAEKALGTDDQDAVDQHDAIINDLLLSLEVPGTSEKVADNAPADMTKARTVLAEDVRTYDKAFDAALEATKAGSMMSSDAVSSLQPHYVNLQFRAERDLLDATRMIEGLDKPVNSAMLAWNLAFGIALLAFGAMTVWLWQRWRGSMSMFVASTEAERSRFRDLALAAADWFIELDSELHVSAVSEPPEGTHEVPFIVECAIGLRLQDAVAGDYGLKSNWAPCLTAMQNHEPVKRFRYIVANPLLGPRHYELNGLPYFSNTNEFLGYRLAIADITTQVEALTKHDEVSQLLNSLFEHSPAIISVKDVEGRYTAMNRAAESVLGVDRSEALGHDSSILSNAELAERITEEDSRVMESEEPMTFEHDMWIDGILRTYQTTRFPILDTDGCMHGVGAIGVDVTDRRRAEQEIQRRANYDSLTDLPNRHLFQDRLTQALASAKRTGQPLAVLHINLDGFRAINDVRGESVGDQILVETSWRVKSCLRDTDTVARLTGDEFGIILTNLEKAVDVAKIAEKISATISEPVTIDGISCYLTVGVGYSVWPDGGETAEAMTRHADIALHRAKRSGPGRIVCYSADIGDALKQHQIIAQSLKSAVPGKELFVMYQPLVDAITQEVVAAEALIRWENRDLGLVRPDRFIPIAEESDAIIDIGSFVLRRACRDAATWNEKRRRAVSVSVNVSPKQLLRTEFVDTVKSVLN